jgi:myo-inositol-1(or 4)-monophosphatase
MQAILNIAIRGVRKAGAYLMRERERLETHPSSDKISPLQAYAESLISEAVNKAYPDHTVISSHSAAVETVNDAVWYLEVVSGYENLVRNIPHYAFVINIEEKNKTKYGLIYNPHTDEIFTAVAGGGAQCNTYKLRIKTHNHLNDAILATSQLQAGQLKKAEQLQTLNQAGAALYNEGCSALSLAYVAAGRLDGFFGSALSKTVINVGSLFIKESGGLVGDLTGGVAYLQKGELLAANPKLFKTLIQELKNKE